jgi:hypothetical protein
MRYLRAAKAGGILIILPTKHSSYDRSLLVLGAKVIQTLSEPKTVSRIWDEIRNDNSRERNYLTYEWFILSLDLLYLLNIIELHRGLISKKVNHDS